MNYAALSPPLFLIFLGTPKPMEKKRGRGGKNRNCQFSVDHTAECGGLCSRQDKRQGGGGGYLKLEFSASSSFIDDDDSRGGYVNID